MNPIWRQWHFRALPVALVTVLWLVGIQAVPLVYADKDVDVFKSDSAPYGRTYGEWAAAWNQWATSIPATHHPLFDSADGSVGQSGPVWFLGGKFCYNYSTGCPAGVAVRYLTVPAGKALFFPVLDAEDSMIEDPLNAGLINGLRQYSESNIDHSTDLWLEVDGVRLPDLKADFRVQSTAFSFMLPDDNIFKAAYPKDQASQFPAGTFFPGVDDGVFVMLRPLPIGHHKIHFHGFFPNLSFTIDITYFITVTKI